jgi:hypothetical protein
MRPWRKRRIVVITHEREREDHAIRHTADFWLADGLEVLFLRGVDEFVPADLAIMHVDLSVVPPEYVEFARQYPVTLNGEVTDIRKTAFSALRVTRASDYAGKVIVKSNLNFGGEPERRLGVRTDALPQGDYPIYDSPGEVPDRFFEGEDFIVEKFVPEVENGRYHARAFHFFGDRFNCERIASDDPIVTVTDPTRIEREDVEAHPDVFELKKKLKIDFGKIDYVQHDGSVSLLDVNKTPGAYAGAITEATRAARRDRADGLYAYLR